MTYDVFLEQMKNDLQTAFSREMPEKYSQVKIGIRDVEKLQGSPTGEYPSGSGILRLRAILICSRRIRNRKPESRIRRFSDRQRKLLSSRQTECPSLISGSCQASERSAF